MHLYTMLFREGYGDDYVALSTWASSCRHAEHRARYSLGREDAVLIRIERQ